jgi:predicted nucleotidyltransferase
MPATGFPDLDELLEELAARMQSTLGRELVGLYLQGSFALGDADEHSDVDWIAVTDGDLTADQIAALQTMHAELYARDTPWAQHLEGSYFPKGRLRRIEASPAELWFLDNGSCQLALDAHCNTPVVRWTLREHGITLVGPDPKELIDPVSGDDLRAYARWALAEWVEWAKSLESMSRRAQNLLVVSFCRILQTLETGEVTSKREAGAWALESLPAQWSGLITEALDDRPDPWTKVHQPATANALERTLTFAAYALSRRRPSRP